MESPSSLTQTTGAALSRLIYRIFTIDGRTLYRSTLHLAMLKYKKRLSYTYIKQNIYLMWHWFQNRIHYLLEVSYFFKIINVLKDVVSAIDYTTFYIRIIEMEHYSLSSVLKWFSCNFKEWNIPTIILHWSSKLELNGKKEYFCKKIKGTK